MQLVGEIASTLLRFDDGAPVRAASAIASFAGGWLIAQDDATSAAWVTPGSIRRLRVLPPVEGHDVFAESAGTKHLKPDFEAAVLLPELGDAVLLLGSGSSPERTRACLVEHSGGSVETTVRELDALYARIAEALGVATDALNLEGACLTEPGTVRWFARGNPHAGIPSASVELSVSALVEAVRGGRQAHAVEIGVIRRLDLGEVAGVALAVTDAVALPTGNVLVSAAAEDTPNAVDDGPVVAAALALLDGGEVLAMTTLPEVDGRVAKIEGLALRAIDGRTADLVAVVDDDVEGAPSSQLSLRLAW